LLLQALLREELCQISVGLRFLFEEILGGWLPLLLYWLLGIAEHVGAVLLRWPDAFAKHLESFSC